jgi:chromosomal replication initiation ATPase DnaA
MTRADFLDSDANRAAVATIDAWPVWPRAGVILVGPAGSGKTHLVEVWREAAGAAVVAAPALAGADVPALAARGAVAVEDLHAGIADEAALFHLMNLSREGSLALLLTSRAHPAALALALADVASRLRAATLVELGAIDDPLLRRVLVKLFADRQLAVDPAVVDYLVVRMERSLAAADALVAAVDRSALAAGGRVTRALVAAVLAGEAGNDMENPGDS